MQEIEISLWRFELPAKLDSQSGQDGKGQLISKCFFVSSILPKTNKNNSTLGTIVVKSNFLFCFGRIEDTKKTFRN